MERRKQRVPSAKGGTKKTKAVTSKSTQPVLAKAKKSPAKVPKKTAKPTSVMPKLTKKPTKSVASPKKSANSVTKINQKARKTEKPTKPTKVEKTIKKEPSQIGGRVKKRPYKHAGHKQPNFVANPLAEYVEGTDRRRHHKKRYIPRRRRIERQIMAMLACFSISIGLWENFRQLWLQGNGFSATDVSNIVSFGLLLSVVGILIVGKAVKMSKIKNFMLVVLILRSINMLAMYLLDGSGASLLINFGAALDVLTGTLIITSVYPLLTTVMKSNRAYSRRKLVEYLFRDIGVLIGGLLIGQAIAGYLVDYNSCLLISGIFSVASSVIMWQIQPIVVEHATASKFSVKKYIWKNPIQRTYMLYAFLAGAAYMATIGLRMLMLTDFFGLSARMGTNYLLLVGLASDVLGILALKYFTPKNDYVTIAIKFGTRLLIFTGAFLTDSLFLCFVSLTWTLLSSTAYENITDGYYINAIDNRHQLKYNTIKYVATTTGEAAGTFLCGQMFELGPKYIFGASAVVIVFQLGASFYLIYLRHKQKRRKTSARRNLNA